MAKSTLPEITSDMQVVETYDPGTAYNRFFNHTRTSLSIREITGSTKGKP